jgi:bisanhydrobacterioruberin hydratase
MEIKLDRKNIATAIAILFHVSGAIGILLSNQKEWFVGNTVLNLLLMVGLLIWNQPEKNSSFFLFLLVAFITGMGVEMIGVNTATLFGVYQYGNLMGPKLNGVPWLIGLNWFVLIFCCGILITKMHHWLEQQYELLDINLAPWVSKLSLLVDAAFLATLFDWLMEPVAMKLGFWEWKDSTVPMYNYGCWFVISLILVWVFGKLRFNKNNHFAVDLLFIQALFFLALRTFL